MWLPAIQIQAMAYPAVSLNTATQTQKVNWKAQEPTCVTYVRIIIVIIAFGEEPEGSQEHASVVVQEVQTEVPNDLLTIE